MGRVMRSIITGDSLAVNSDWPSFQPRWITIESDPWAYKFCDNNQVLQCIDLYGRQSVPRAESDRLQFTDVVPARIEIREERRTFHKGVFEQPN